MSCTMWPTLGGEHSIVFSVSGGKNCTQKAPQKEPKQANFVQNSHFVAKETWAHVWLIDTAPESSRVKRMTKV